MNQIIKQQMCVKTRFNIDFFLDKERAENLIFLLANGKCDKFIKIDEELINTADITAILLNSTVKKMTEEEKLWKYKK